MAHPKRRVYQHIMEARSFEIIRRMLPEQWIVREYRPDYGIDLTVELFEYLDEGRTQAATLGETLFVQVKAKKTIEARDLRVYPRRNVEVGPLQEDRSHSREIKVASLQLETSELLMVQAMGPAVPMLLLLVDISTEQVRFLCLSDFVEKVLLPSDPDFAKKASKVVHVPLRNTLSAPNPDSLAILEFYAKRPKLYAAFQKFRYQQHELRIHFERYQGVSSAERKEAEGREFLGLARHFLEMDLRFDFWTRSSAWNAIRFSHAELEYLRRFLGEPGAEHDPDRLRRFLLEQPFQRRDHHYYSTLTPEGAEEHVFSEIAFIWDRLENLSGIYEEMVREWFLPTYFACDLTPDLRAMASNMSE